MVSGEKKWEKKVNEKFFQEDAEKRLTNLHVFPNNDCLDMGQSIHVFKWWSKEANWVLKHEDETVLYIMSTKGK